MTWAMSTNQKETANIAGDWLYRGVAIYFLWNIYLDVQHSNKQDAVFQERIDRHELRLTNIEQAMFVPAWKGQKQSSYEHGKETQKLIDLTENNLAEAIRQLGTVDSFLEINN